MTIFGRRLGLCPVILSTIISHNEKSLSVGTSLVRNHVSYPSLRRYRCGDGISFTRRTVQSKTMSSSSCTLPSLDDTVTIPRSFRGVFVGSGSDGMSDPRIAKIVLDLVPPKCLTPSSSSTCNSNNIGSDKYNDTNGRSQDDHHCHHPAAGTPPINVVYLGTATYDLPQFAKRQTQCFAEMGCHVEMLNLAHTCTTGTTATSRNDLDDDEHDLTEHARKVLDGADVVVVGGGNTLYAIDRWKSLGVDKLLEQAMDRGVVLTGGSAGAICWFDAGHSDSCDPSSFYTSMMRNFGPKATTTTTTTTDGTGPADDDESLPPPDESELGGDGDDDLNNKGKDWKYIRVPCLGFLPGLCCPHHDRVQSNGVLRADDFDEMLLTRHSGELGIAIDHWAALVVDGGDDSYRVVSLDGKKGSVIYQNDEKIGDSGNETSTSVASFSRDANGVPGVWLKEVQDGKVVQRILPPSGKLSNVLRRAAYISRSDDDAIEECRRMNVPTMDA